jgi:hypothetical protein
VFFATIGVVDFSEATVIGIAALTMAFFFIVTMWSFSRSGDGRSADRERRGFSAAILVAPATVVIPAVTLALSSLTLYGVAASRRTGKCGCSRAHATSTPRQVAYRNGAVALVAVTGTLFTPRVTSETLAAAAPFVGYAPGAMLVSLVSYPGAVGHGKLLSARAPLMGDRRVDR